MKNCTMGLTSRLVFLLAFEFDVKAKAEDNAEYLQNADSQSDWTYDYQVRFHFIWKPVQTTLKTEFGCITFCDNK